MSEPKTKEEQELFNSWTDGERTDNYKYVEDFGEMWEDIDGWYCIPDWAELGVSGPFSSALDAYESLKRSKQAQLRNKEDEKLRDCG